MKKSLLALVIASSALAAHAEGFYVGAGAGYNAISDDSASINSRLVSEVGGSASTTLSKAVANIRLTGGYKFNEYVALELGYLMSSKYTLSSVGRASGNVPYTVNGDVSFSGFDVSAIVRPSVASGYNNFFATVGLHSLTQKTNVTFVGGGSTVSESSSQSGTGMLYGVGYDWAVNKGLDLRVAVIRLDKLAGSAGSNTTNFGVSLIKHF